MTETVLFYFLALIILFFSAGVVLLRNPIYSALSLAVTMVSLGFVYFLLNAPFIAGVQLIVYAGAVMVLFVMVVMLFDLKKEKDAYSGNVLSVLVKLVSGILFILIVGGTVRAIKFVTSPALTPQNEQMADVKAMAMKLFTEYVFAFEALGVLLLIIAIGVVAVSRTKGGSHA